MLQQLQPPQVHAQMEHLQTKSVAQVLGLSLWHQNIKTALRYHGTGGADTSKWEWASGSVEFSGVSTIPCPMGSSFCWVDGGHQYPQRYDGFPCWPLHPTGVGEPSVADTFQSGRFLCLVIYAEVSYLPVYIVCMCRQRQRQTLSQSIDTCLQ